MLKFPFHNIAVNEYKHIQTLRCVCIGLFLFCWFLGYGWLNAKKDMVVHVPPDLRSGAMLKLNDPKPYNVYSFALMVMQLLNHWPKDGAKDYGQNIYDLSAYLTPSCSGKLQANLKERSQTALDDIGTPVNELTGRVRTAQPVSVQGYQESAVTILGNGAWVVKLDLHIEEAVEGLVVKAVDIRYPVQVISYDVDPSRNPYGLAIDCYAEPGPTRLTHIRNESDNHAGGIPEQQEEVKLK